MEKVSSRQKSFVRIYDSWEWGGETRSGVGSGVDATELLREDLQQFITNHNIRSIVDVGCGEFHWQQYLDLTGIEVTGIDIVDELVINNQTNYPEHRFICHDIVESPIDIKADLYIVRDLFQHLDTEDIRRAIKNILGQSTYLLINHSPHLESNTVLNRNSGRYRPINLFKEPFNFPRGNILLRDFDNRATTIWRTEQLQKLDWLSAPKEPIVLLAILVRDKAHLLPDYLSHISQQTYRKDRIVVYIHTGDNHDNTSEILKSWVEQNRNQYRDIEFVEESHDWSPKHKYDTMGKIREISLKKTIQYNCDYYFVVSCDNFIRPETLTHLINLSYPIVGPLLRSFPSPIDPYSNYFFKCNPWGYYSSDPFYFEILEYRSIGNFRVDLIHSTYLIDRRVIDLLHYVNGTGTLEFIVFSQYARLGGVNQYVSNELEFGTIFHPPADISRLEEVAIFRRHKLSPGLLKYK